MTAAFEVQQDEYLIRPLEWSIDRATQIWQHYMEHKIMPDDVPTARDGFIAFLLSSGGLWFDVLQNGESVGIMFITDLIRNIDRPGFFSANWHAAVWDNKVTPRVEAARACIRMLFTILKLHRLQSIIPLRFGGTIRLAKKIGFKEEGVMREMMRYDGEWNGCLLLSILESDAIVKGDDHE